MKGKMCKWKQHARSTMIAQIAKITQMKMQQYKIEYERKLTGFAVVDAETYAEANDKAEELLVKDKEINWTSDDAYSTEVRKL